MDLVERTDDAKQSGARFDVVVIGAGQAGLAMGHCPARQDRRFVILDAADSIGAARRSRLDSLVLFTPRRYDGLPGLAFPGDPDGYPTRDEVIAYLEYYAQTFDLPVVLDSPVRSLTTQEGRFVVGLHDGRIEADQVVVATGPFQVPNVPALAGELAPDVFQTHSNGYRRPGDLPEGRVLVVGGGNTGFQIAKELSSTRPVHLSVGSRQTPLPQRILGRDLFWGLTKLGVLEKTVDSRLGRRARHRDTLIGSSPRELKRRYGVETKPRAVRASGRNVGFADGTELELDAVIWATGYRPRPVVDRASRARRRRPRPPSTGRHRRSRPYFLGLSWQHTRGSALLGWVKDDAEFLAAQIDASASIERAHADHTPENEGALAPRAAGATQGA